MLIMGKFPIHSVNSHVESVKDALPHAQTLS